MKSCALPAPRCRRHLLRWLPGILLIFPIGLTGETVIIDPVPIGQAQRLANETDFRANPVKQPVKIGKIAAFPVQTMLQGTATQPATTTKKTITAPTIQKETTPSKVKVTKPAVTATATNPSAVKQTTKTATSQSKTAVQLQVSPVAVKTSQPALSRSHLQAIEQTRVMKPVVYEALPMRADMLRLTDFKFGVNQKDAKESGAQGPVTTFIDVLEALTADVVGLDRTDILNIAPEIFQDGNKESGLFYYHPQSYNLAWTADGGYGMRMLYGAAREVGASGEVVMTARLDARVGVTDAQLIRRLMEAHVKRNPGITFRELRPMPLKEPPAVSLSYGLTSLYEIPTERIVTTQLSDALASIDIAFATDTITIENLQMLLKENVGINGKVVFAPASKTVASREIPLEINIASPQTFGVFPWTKQMLWKNETPYPLTLKYLHALILKDDQPHVYSWDLGNTLCVSGGDVRIRPDVIPAWFDKYVLRYWIDYRPETSDRSIHDEVVAGISGGVSKITATNIVIRSLRPLEDLQAFEIQLELRTRFSHPRDRGMKSLNLLVIESDNREYEFGPLYQPEDLESSGPLFEYRMTVVLEDGSTYTGESWIPVSRNRVIIGRVQVADAIGRDLTTP